jgi:hypothetical protein
VGERLREVPEVLAGCGVDLLCVEQKRPGERQQLMAKPRMTSPVQAPSVTCDLAAINVGDLAGDVGGDCGNRMPSTTSLTWPRGPAAECVVAFRRVHRRLDPVFAHGISLREPAWSADIDLEEVE